MGTRDYAKFNYYYIGQTVIIGLDFETKSDLDITKVGSYKYSMHPSTDVLMFWAVPNDDEEQPVYWSPYARGLKPYDLGDDTFVAWNRWFEYCIWNNVLVPKYGFKPLHYSQIIDAQDQARTHSLAPKLETCCEQLKLPELKNPEGMRLIQLFSIDQEKPADHPKDWQMFNDYCYQDVIATLGVYNYLPKLSTDQQAVSDLTLRINERGLALDMVGCAAAQKLVAGLKAEGEIRIKEMTKGVVERATQRDRVKKWLFETQDLILPNMQAGTIVSFLGYKISDSAREMLHLYQVCGKSSVAKFNAFEKYVCDDGRCHEVLIYHGAGPGRWTGVGIQFQNMPRPVLPKGTNYEDVLGAIKNLPLSEFKKFCDNIAKGTDWRSNPMEAILSCIRTMVQADVDKVFYAADYSAIEARVAVWLAGELFAIDAYQAGEDAYITMASETLHIEDFEVDDLQRFMGKQQILSCQFGVGWKAFRKLLKEKYNVDISAKEAKKLVNAYRAKYTMVVEAWKLFQTAAILAIKNKGLHCPTHCKGVYFVYEDKFLYCELPSGRRIAYPYPRHQIIPQVWDKEREEWRNPRKGEDKKIKMLDHITYLKKIEHKWVRGKFYGASAFQGATQGTAACCMGVGLLNVEAAGYPPNLSVHDEGVSEVAEDFGSLDEYLDELCRMPKWADGLPVKAEGWQGYVYRK